MENSRLFCPAIGYGYRLLPFLSPVFLFLYPVRMRLRTSVGIGLVRHDLFQAFLIHVHKFLSSHAFGLSGWIMPSISPASVSRALPFNNFPEGGKSVLLKRFRSSGEVSLP